MSALKILHVFSTFAPGGAQVRTLELMNHLGNDFEHWICSMDGVTTAAARIASGVSYHLLPPLPRGTLPAIQMAPAMFRQVAPDLLVTYNWGAMDVAMAAALHRPCPFLHTEDGFGADEAQRLKLRRVLTRRIVLKAAYGVAVPSRTLERIALERYRVPPRKVLYLPNGVDVSTFAPRSNAAAREAFQLPPHSLVVGSVGHLRAEKDFGNLIRAFARLPHENARLLLVGDGPCRDDLAALARQLGCAERVCFAGLLREPALAYDAMDIFALSSATEQMPVALLEAMSSGLPAVCTNVGDCAEMLDRSEPPFIVPPAQPGHLAAALETLLADAGLRRTTGEHNRDRCLHRFSKDLMIEDYRQTYLRAGGRTGERVSEA
ncbi:MAG: glycosyltransferase [Acidobacteria bacterium]|nr:glycosyltransferase [Acidobacteriota bacterium]